MTTYIITVQASETQNIQMRNFVRGNGHIKAYWNYIPSVYCVKTDLSSAQLRERIDSLFPNGGFLIAELNARNIDGRLPNDAWTWFYDPSPLESLAMAQEPYGTSPSKPSGLMSLDLGSKPQGKKGLLGS